MPTKYYKKSFRQDGKRVYVYGKTEKEALLKLIEKQKELETEQVKKSDLTVRAWARTALETYKPNVSEDGKRIMLYRIEKHILGEIGARRLQDVTPLDCQRILNAQKGKSKSHITKLSQELFFIFDTARKNKLIAENPAADVVKPDGTEHARRALTADERAHLLAVIPQDPRFTFFSLMLFAGCRPAEAAAVRYEDVTEIDGVPFLHIRGTKTKNSDRLVPIPEELKPILLTGKTGLVAPNSAGSKHDVSSYRRMVSSLERAMNISMGAEVYRNELMTRPLADDFVPYLLRHTYCTDLKKRGVDVRIAKNLMGHANITTTANIYDHEDDDTLLLAARQLNLYPQLYPQESKKK